MNYQEILHELGLNILEGLEILLNEDYDLSDNEIKTIKIDKYELDSILKYGVNGDYEIETILSLALKYRRVE